ncbi:MAG: FAD-dependent oxidoreductase, partial [Gemmatimonadetes bacterium]|nr:FAD-dependent oxidoreductase [Gemmatimonadota bacterium]
GETKKFDRVLVAIGVMGNVDGLGLEAAGVELERGRIVVDADMRTTCPGIYAIGDVAGGPWLAHKASAEGIHCVERIAGHAGRPVRYDNIPGCTYCEPQVASVGLTEEQAREKGLKVKVGKFPNVASGKALALDEKEGFVKVLYDEGTGELLGAHMIGHNVTELIAEMVLARTLEATEAEIL